MRKGLAAAAVVLLFPCSHAFVGPACPCASSQMFSTTSDTSIRNPNDLRRTGRAGFTPPLRRQHQQTQQQISILKRTVARMTSFDPSAFDSAVPAAFPQGPGAGVIDLRFENLKAGGFKVFLLLFLLGQGRAKDNDTPFSVRDTPEGIRVLIGDETKDDSQWDGVLDLSWGVEPYPFFRVDRIDVNEVIPYPGELYILNKLLDAIIDVNGEQAVDEHSKLFMFREGEQNQLAEAKATLASMAALG